MTWGKKCCYLLVHRELMAIQHLALAPGYSLLTWHLVYAYPALYRVMFVGMLKFVFTSFYICVYL